MTYHQGRPFRRRYKVSCAGHPTKVVECSFAGNAYDAAVTYCNDTLPGYEPVNKKPSAHTVYNPDGAVNVYQVEAYNQTFGLLLWVTEIK